jgi:hypothetical protein
MLGSSYYLYFIGKEARANKVSVDVPWVWGRFIALACQHTAWGGDEWCMCNMTVLTQGCCRGYRWTVDATGIKRKPHGGGGIWYQHLVGWGFHEEDIRGLMRINSSMGLIHWSHDVIRDQPQCVTFILCLIISWVQGIWSTWVSLCVSKLSITVTNHLR